MKQCPACGREGLPESWVCPACGFSPPRDGRALLFAPVLAEADGGFDAALYPRMATVEDAHFWFQARKQLVTWAFGAYFAEARSFLEIGCGTGLMLAALREAHPTLRLAGVEAHPDGLRFAARRLPEDVQLWQMDARALPLRGAFDAIGAFDVIEHIEADEAVLASFRRALVPGGGLLLTVPQHRWLWSPVDDAVRHVRRYTRVELVEKLGRAGFTVVHVTSFVSLILPLVVLSRRLLALAVRLGKQEVDATHELHLPQGLNGWLGRVLTFERALLRRGVSFRAGASLLVVARAA